MNPLRLIAQNPDEISIVSAHAQDAVIRIADIAHIPQKHIFVLMMNRFRWETPHKKQRVRSALTIRNVLSVRQKWIAQERQNAVIALLAVAFTPCASKPSGTIQLLFSGGAVIDLSVDSCALVLEDVSGAWTTRSVPKHEHDN